MLGDGELTRQNGAIGRHHAHTDDLGPIGMGKQVGKRDRGG